MQLAQALIRCPSVTPDDAGALAVLERTLMALGFRCRRMPFSDPGTPDIDNLYAEIGEGHPHFCFAGHTDVVPAGDEARWSFPPFDGIIDNHVLFGRGAADMKGAIAAFAAAATRFLATGALKGRVSFLITGDEEGPAINGTRKMLEALAEDGVTIDHCLVGEPTNPHRLGDMIKIGRRGSINGWLTVHGAQGHVAYPHLADNPVPRLVEMLRRLNEHELDPGTDHFQPSNLEITSVDVGNTATNVIPAEARAVFNIRFNDQHTPESLETWVRTVFDGVVADMGGSYDLTCKASGSAFVTEPGAFTTLVAEAVAEVTGQAPELSTTGGTSDARFIRAYAPVVEFGLINQSMHKVDEHAAVADIEGLADIYFHILSRYFDTPPA